MRRDVGVRMWGDISVDVGVGDEGRKWDLCCIEGFEVLGRSDRVENSVCIDKGKMLFVDFCRVCFGKKRVGVSGFDGMGIDGGWESVGIDVE